MKLLLQEFFIYVMDIEVVSPAIQEVVFYQHSLGLLSPMNQLNVEYNPQQLQDERSWQALCADKILNSHLKDA